MAKLIPFFQRYKSNTLGVAYALVVLAFAWTCAQFYLPGKGFTYLIEFGDRSNATYLPELKAVNHFEDSRSDGYDGQYYAQIAMRPNVADAELKQAVPDLAYRARRILFCWTAYVFAGADPVRALHLYAVQNIIAWFLLALLLLRWFPVKSWGNWFRWTAVLLAFGLSVSVRKSLVDGPSLLLIACSVALLESKKPWLAAAMGGFATLGRETSFLIASAFIPALNWTKTWKKTLGQVVLLILPLSIWLIILATYTSASGGAGARNFAYPLVGYGHKLFEIIHLFKTAPDWIIRGSVFILIALTVQALFFITRLRVSEPWWRVGVSYALFMLILGDEVWEGYPGAAARVVLPMTLAFNILVPRGKKWWAVLILGNLTVLVTPETLNPPGRESVVVVGPRSLRMVDSTGQIVDAQFDSNWYGPEKSRLEYWRWAKASASVALINPHPISVHATISFHLRSNDIRDVVIKNKSQELWRGTLIPREPTQVVITSVDLEPGETLWQFETSKAVNQDNATNAHAVTFSLRNLKIELINRFEKAP